MDENIKKLEDILVSLVYDNGLTELEIIEIVSKILNESFIPLF